MVPKYLCTRQRLKSWVIAIFLYILFIFALTVSNQEEVMLDFIDEMLDEKLLKTNKITYRADKINKRNVLH